MSEELKNKKCAPCEGGTPPLDKEQVENLKRQVSEDWHLEDSPSHQTGNAATTSGEKILHSGVGASKIWVEFKFKNFKEVIAFVNKVADIAEVEGHHPDIFISYSKVKIELWTHAVGGLSENDFILAAKIDELIRN